MKNVDMAAIFYAVADILEIQKVQWKPIAYRKAARTIEALSENIEEIYKKGGLKAFMELPGIGEGLAKKIEEFIKTGKVKSYERLKKEMPAGIGDLVSIPGLGPKKAYRLFKELKIKGIPDLESAIKEHKIAKLEGFGAKSEENITRSLQLVKTGQKRTLLGVALPIADLIVSRLRKVKGVERIETAGSLRRHAETVGDIDILVTTENAGAVMDAFVKMLEVIQVLAKGPTKSMVVLKYGQHTIQSDVRVLEDKSYGAALQYFTGNKEHNIAMRRIAIKKGYKLSEYGVFDKKGRMIAGKNEEDVYKALGVPWIPPELRENRGEIEASIKGNLPDPVKLSDIKGDLHIHTTWSEGRNSIRETVAAAEKIGYEYIAITDHSKSERIAYGMDEKKLLKYIAEIRGIAKEKKRIKVFAGCEIDILPNGELDYSDEYLKKLDFPIISIHSRFKSSKKEMTDRVLAAFTNKYVKVFCHPTGRLIFQREPYEIDMEKILEEAAQRKIAMEINSFPERLDLNDVYTKRAVEMGVKLIINTDAHHIDQLRYMKYGVSVARRGWAEKKDVVNTYSLKDFSRYFGLRI